MVIIQYPPRKLHNEIQASLKNKDTMVISFTGCAAACPGAIVVLDGMPGRWVVCWVDRNQRMILTDNRAGVMPLPEGHTGPWTAEHGWEVSP